MVLEHVYVNSQTRIPSHIGITGNDKANELAKTITHKHNVQLRIQPKPSQIKKMMASTVRQNMIEDIRQIASQGSPAANWYLLATDLIPHRVTKNTHRNLAVTMHRLRLGYKAN